MIKPGDWIEAVRDIDTERGTIPARMRLRVQEISAAGLHVLPEGFSAYLRVENFLVLTEEDAPTPPAPTLTLDELIDHLLGIRVRIGGGRAVRLIINGTAHPAPQAWFERGQDNGAGAICIGDDPR